MNIKIREYKKKDLPEMIEIWNEIVEEGVAYPQEEYLTIESGTEFFSSQTYTAAAVDIETEVVCPYYRTL